ncbi:MAG: outer membrane protein assembly factor BamA [Spirochaetaceae bacterium]|nr:MAG: outer membrane protein assembly factor BamA [Spirochaetaceae bacterium]
MPKRLLAPAVLFFLTVALVFAQNNDEWYLNKPIQNVTFDGLINVSDAELRAVVTPFIGRDFTEPVFLDLQRRLYALDYFEQIIPSAKPADADRTRVILEFTVTERPIVNEVVFSGNRRVRTGELTDSILLGRGDLVNRTKIRLAEEALTQLYLEKGFPDVTVQGSFVRDEARNTANVSFVIDEGLQTTIREIRFVGNVSASAGTLRGVMESKQQSIFNSGVFQEALIERDRRAIENHYRNRGYIDARVLEIERELERDEDQNRTFVTLTVYVEEGAQYTYGGMSFEGNSIFSDEQLEALLRFRPGSVMNAERVNADFQRVADLYYDNGYIYNEISRREIRDEEELIVSYVVSIVEYGRAHIENIIVRGNEKTEDFVILREIPLQVGDVFSSSRAREAQFNLLNLQYFSAVVPELVQGSTDGLMDFIINVEETGTADIRFGIQFGGSMDFPVAAQISWQDRNFLGRGQTFGVELNASPVNQRLQLNFLERWLTGRRWEGGANILIDRTIRSNVRQDVITPVFSREDFEAGRAVPDPYTGEYVFPSTTEFGGITYGAGDPFPGNPTPEQIDQYNLVTDYVYAGGSQASIPPEYLMSYQNLDISLGLTTAYRFRTPVGALRLGTGFRTGVGWINYDADVYRPYDPNTRENLRNWVFTNRLNVNASLDNRDFVFSPSRGSLFSQQVTFVGGLLLGERHYIKTETKAEAYVTLFDIPVTENWNWKTVLGAHSSISFILPQFWVPANQRDRLDSFDTQVSSTDLLFIDGMFTARGWRQLDNRPLTGGRALWNNWVELRMPISEQIVWFDTFFDAAVMYDDPAEIAGFGIEDMLFSTGFGLRFTIPQLPIRLYLARRFTIEDGKLVGDSRPGAGLFQFFDFVFAIGLDF